jgi:hypothetical protein
VAERLQILTAMPCFALSTLLPGPMLGVGHQTAAGHQLCRWPLRRGIGVGDNFTSACTSTEYTATYALRQSLTKLATRSLACGSASSAALLTHLRWRARGPTGTVMMSAARVARRRGLSLVDIGAVAALFAITFPAELPDKPLFASLVLSAVSGNVCPVPPRPMQFCPCRSSPARGSRHAGCRGYRAGQVDLRAW